jgi:hypothetical protein
MVVSVIGVAPIGADCKPPNDGGGVGVRDILTGARVVEIIGFPQGILSASSGDGSDWGGGGGTKSSKLIEIGGGLKNCLSILYNV